MVTLADLIEAIKNLAKGTDMISPAEMREALRGELRRELIDWPKLRLLKLIRRSETPVLTVGVAGAWDQITAEDPEVIKVGATYVLYYSGRRNAWPRYMGIGRATSADGVTWVKEVTNPVLAQGVAGAWDEGIVRDSCVMRDGVTYKMWYAGSSFPVTADTRHYVGYATSLDGIVWTKFGGNPVLSPSGEEWSIGDPFIKKIGDTYYLFYTALNVGDTKRWTSLATSSDGVTWTKVGKVLDVGPIGDTYDDYNAADPEIFALGSLYVNFYTAVSLTDRVERICIAVSSDLVNWRKLAASPLISPLYGWEASSTAEATVVKEKDRLLVWYEGGTPGALMQIGFAEISLTDRIEQLLVGNITFNNVITTYTSRAVQCDGFRKFTLLVNKNVANTPTNIEVQVQVSDDGVTFYELKNGPFGSLFYERTAGQEYDAQSGDLAVKFLRVVCTATGTTAVNTFTLTVKVVLAE